MNRLEEYMRYGASDHVTESKWNQVAGRVNQEEAQTRSTTHQLATQQLLQTPLTPYQQRIYGGIASNAPQRSNSSRSRSASPAGGSTHRVFSCAPVSSHRPRSASPPPHTGGLSSTNTALQTQLTPYQQGIYGGGASSAPQSLPNLSPLTAEEQRLLIQKANKERAELNRKAQIEFQTAQEEEQKVQAQLKILKDKDPGLYSFINNTAQKYGCHLTSIEFAKMAYYVLSCVFDGYNYIGLTVIYSSTGKKLGFKATNYMNDQSIKYTKITSTLFGEDYSKHVENTGINCDEIVRMFNLSKLKLKIFLDDKYAEYDMHMYDG